jgi:hypothetical protein
VGPTRRRTRQERETPRRPQENKGTTRRCLAPIRAGGAFRAPAGSVAASGPVPALCRPFAAFSRRGAAGAPGRAGRGPAAHDRPVDRGADHRKHLARGAPAGDPCFLEAGGAFRAPAGSVAASGPVPALCRPFAAFTLPLGALVAALPPTTALSIEVPITGSTSPEAHLRFPCFLEAGGAFRAPAGSVAASGPVPALCRPFAAAPGPTRRRTRQERETPRRPQENKGTTRRCLAPISPRRARCRPCAGPLPRSAGEEPPGRRQVRPQVRHLRANLAAARRLLAG